MLRNGPEEHYSPRFDFDACETAPTTRLLIATLPRTGSTQMCIQLWRTAAAGAPLEYLNLALRRHDMIPRLGDGDILEYWKNLQRCRTSGNGVFSVKAFITDYRKALKSTKDLLPLIQEDKIVYLTRRNKLLQAISWLRAQQTHKWFFDAEERGASHYDTDLILDYLDRIHDHETAWEAFFRKKGRAPLRVFYEDFEAGEHELVGKILSFIGAGGECLASMEVTDFQVQRDETTLDWAKRFKSEVELDEAWGAG